MKMSILSTILPKSLGSSTLLLIKTSIRACNVTVTAHLSAICTPISKSSFFMTFTSYLLVQHEYTNDEIMNTSKAHPSLNINCNIFDITPRSGMQPCMPVGKAGGLVIFYSTPNRGQSPAFLPFSSSLSFGLSFGLSSEYLHQLGQAFIHFACPAFFPCCIQSGGN